MIETRTFCVFCGQDAGRPVEGQWFCHLCREWQKTEAHMRRLLDEARADVAKYEGALTRLERLAAGA